MKVQVHSSLELPLEHKENQKPLSNQSWLWPYVTNLRVKEILYSFRLGIKWKEYNKCQTPSQVNIFFVQGNLQLLI